MSQEFLIGRPSRRRLVQGGFGVAAGSLLGGLPSAFGQAESPIAARAIPHSGERIPVIGLGTANEFRRGRKADARANLKKVVDDLLAQGCKLIDTASSYGSAESVLGDLLSDQDRAKVFLATKIENGSKQAAWPNSGVRCNVCATSRSISCNCIMCRIADRISTPFRDWKAQGLCRYVGITTTYKSDYDAAEAVLRREKPDFFQVDYSLADRDAEKRLLPAARDAGAAVLTALPFGRKFGIRRGSRQERAGMGARFRRDDLAAVLPEIPARP